MQDAMKMASSQITLFDQFHIMFHIQNEI
jgi:hypothetical protein